MIKSIIEQMQAMKFVSKEPTYLIVNPATEYELLRNHHDKFDHQCDNKFMGLTLAVIKNDRSDNIKVVVK